MRRFCFSAIALSVVIGCLFSGTVCSFAQETPPPTPAIFSYIEEVLVLGDECTIFSEDTYYHAYLNYYLVWSRTTYPYVDPSSPDGYWTAYVWAISEPLSAGSIIGTSEYSGRWQIKWFEGCLRLIDVDATRQATNNENWYAFSNFIYPDGTTGGIASNTAQVILPPEELLAKPQLVAQANMSRTTDPINIATGEMFNSATDFSIATRGPDLELSRMYRSQTEFSGLFGKGWRTAFDVNLTEDVYGNVIHFDQDGTGRYFSLNPDGTYAASAGNFATLVRNADSTYTVTDQHGMAFAYSLEGRISTITDRNGNTLSFIYDPATPNGTYIEDAGRHRITLTLDAGGRVQSAEDPAGRVVQYTYDAAGHLVTITDPAGNAAQYVYDADDNIVEMTNVNGHKTYFAYDAQDRAYMNWQDGDVNKVTLNFGTDMTTVVTDALGNQTSYVFNDFGLETSVTDPLGNTRSTTWDGDMNRTAVTDARGNTTTFAYDNKGNLTGITDALGSQTLYSYTADFNLISTETDALGNTTGFTYDTNGNLLTVTDALGSQTGMSYDASGNPLSTTDALLNVTAFEYDAFGQLTKATDALANETLFTYDAAGNNTSRTDPNTATTGFVYDALNQLTAVNFADGTSMSYAYDAFGNRTSATDQKAQTTAHVFDTYERLVQTMDPLGATTQYTYDNAGNLLTLTDANANTTAFAYDDNGRLLSEITASGNMTANTYDAAGNLISKTDPNGNAVNYTYDALNRLLATQYPDGTSVAYAYDALGRQISMTDTQGVTAYTYDALGRLLSVDGPEAGNTVSYTYDAVGNRISMTNQEGNTVSYGYDALNRQLSVTDTAGPTNYSYDAVSNITFVSYPNGASAAYIYDVMNRPLTVDNVSAGLTTISSLTYTYDAAGMVTKKDLGDSTFLEYQYDAGNRLIRESKKKLGRKGKEETLFDYQYSYGLVNNRLAFMKNTTLGQFLKEDANDMPAQVLDDLTAAGYGAPKSKGDKNQPLKLIKTYSHDQDNRLLAWNYNIEINASVFPVETFAYTYDQNGNRMLEQQMRSGETEPRLTYYGCDYENRLTSLEYINKPNQEGILNAAFEYNGKGLRTKAQEGDIITRFYYDGPNVILETDAAGVTQKSYTRAMGFSGGIGGIVSLTNHAWQRPAKGKKPKTDFTERTFYYHYDALGSAVNLSDETGNSVSTYAYDAFGNTIAANDNSGNNYQFSSKEWEGHAGLYFFGARYYDPSIGRWLTPDPLGFIDGPNVYAYLNNNPVNLIDPWGLSGERRAWWRNISDFIIDSDTFQGSAKLWQASGDDYALRALAVVGTLATTVDAGFNVATGGAKGTVKKGVFVIGENMGKRVIPFAKRIGAEYYKVRNLGRKLRKRETFKALSRNKKVFKKKLRQGYKIIDRGIDPSRSDRSIYYAAEKEIYNRWKLFH